MNQTINLLDLIRALNDEEKHTALCFILGADPDLLARALDAVADIHTSD